MKKRQGINSYWRNVWRRFLARRAGRLALRSLVVFIIIALSSPFVANERPWYIKVEGKNYSPLLQGILVDLGVAKWPEVLFPTEDWADKTNEGIAFTLIPYSPGSIDHKNLNARGPFERQRIESWRFRHWMGTDKTGRDVASGMLHGTRMALWLGLIMVGIAISMGLFLGGIAGYFGDQGLIVPKSRVWAILLFLPFLFFYLAYLPGVVEDASVWTSSFQPLIYLLMYLILVILLDRLLHLLLPKLGRYVVPLDTLLMRLLEVVDAIPSIILVLALIATLEQPTTTYMMVVVGIVGSASVARFVRAEFLKVRQQTYMEAGRALGFTHLRLLIRHALPNALGPLLVLISFSMAGAIVTESTLSILGIGAPDRVTWGSILGELRGQHQIEWWLALFPGLAIFFTVLTFKYLSEGLSEALGEK